MKRRLFISMACLSLFVQISVAQTADSELSVRPIQMVSCATLPDGIAFDVKPMGHEAGFEIFYLVEGKNLIAIKEDSLILSAIKTKEGLDISKSRTGDPTYKQGPFPRVSKDGKYAVFSVKVEHEQFGKVDALTMQGSVVALMASKRETKDLALPVTGKQSKNIGPFTVLSQTGGGAELMGMTSGNNFGIKITGPLSSIIDVKLVAKGGAEKSECNMSDNTSTTFFFSKPSTSEVTVRINYWTDLREQKVMFSK